MISAFPNAPTYTYRPSDRVPGEQNGQSFEQAQLRAKGDHLDAAAQRVTELFERSDNTAVDTDPRAGFVRLRNLPAAGLLERSTESVTGFRTADGDVSVEGTGYYKGPSTLTLSNSRSEVTMERPWYDNQMYLPTQEQLTYNADGSRTVSYVYLQ